MGFADQVVNVNHESSQHFKAMLPISRLGIHSKLPSVLVLQRPAFKISFFFWDSLTTLHRRSISSHLNPISTALTFQSLQLFSVCSPSPLVLIMAEKASSQQIADALFLLDALQHVTSTVVVGYASLPSLTYHSHFQTPDQRRRDRTPNERQSQHRSETLHNSQAALP